MEILTKIIGSEARVKLMRLFLLNKSKVFDSADIGKKTLIKKEKIRNEIRLLSSVNFIRKKTNGYSFDPNFKFKKEFEDILLNSDTLDFKNTAKSFKKSGKINLLIVSGIFIKNPDSRIDLLIVGQKIKKNKVEEVVRKTEIQLGTEISYALFEYNEFIYRLNMYDKLIRDVLDFPNKIIIQTKDIPDSILQKRA